MDVLIATDIHVHIIDNHYYLATQLYTIMNRYYNEFGPITMYCRVSYEKTSEKLIDATNMIKEIIAFQNIFQIITGKYNGQICDVIKNSNLIIGRFHSFSACQCAQIAKKNNKVFLAEVMGDAWDGYWNHGILGKLIAPYIFFWTQKSIYDADFALYVTEKYLQQKYPCKGICTNASNVKIEEISQNVLDKRLNRIQNEKFKGITLMTAANVDVKAKGHEYVIRALPYLLKKDIEVKYYIAGGGDNTYLKAIAEKYHVQDKVCFLGRLNPEKVFEQMEKVDIYIQPSLQEGLPRSVIEAMSRGCPVIGACTAGIPELLDKRFVVKRKNPKDIVEKIILYINMNENEKAKIVKRNFKEAKKYKTDILDLRRKRFFERIKKTLNEE